MVTDILYKEATSTDIPEIVELKLAMFVESCHADKLAENAKEIILEDYLRLYVDNQAQHFVARKGNRILGCVGAFVKNDLPYRYYKYPAYGFIGDVYTVPDSRNMGLSTKLNEMALIWLRRKGIATVKLLSSEAGRPIYEKLGFKSTDEMSITFTT